MMKCLRSLLLFSFLIALPGCAGIAPVPGGTETINKSFYESDSDLKSRIGDISVGMSKEEVLTGLDRTEDQLVMLNREEIISTLYPSTSGRFAYNDRGGKKALYDRDFLLSLSGYKLLFKKISRKHGVSSPIAMRTNESGYSYSAVFIFEDGVLYEKPLLSGGVVDVSSTKTIFDYLSADTVMRRVGI